MKEPLERLAGPSASMVRLIEASWLTKAIHAVAVLGIPDLLRDGPKRSDELAAATGAHASALHRLMRALTAEGIFDADDRTGFSLTPLGATLRSDAPDSLRDWALLMLGNVNQAAWNDLLHSVRTGRCAFEHRYGVGLWQYCERHPGYARTFDAAMAAFTRTYLENLLGSYSFSPFRTLVDIGGGDGSLLIGILRMNPDARGIVYELAAVADRARRKIEEAGLASRCAVRQGDAFADVPAGGDAYILSRILHDWGDEEACQILTACRRALSAEGRVLVIERTMPARLQEIASARTPALSDTVLTDLNMMVMAGGRERTVGEYGELFKNAGLKLVRIVPTPTAMSVIEARAS